MDNTHEFVEKLHDTQKKDKKNKQHGEAHRREKVSSKQHSTNK